MRNAYSLIAIGGVLAAVGAGSAGCIDYVAEYYTPLTDAKLASGGTGGTATSSSTSTSGTGGTPINCIPSEDPKTAVDASCGVFVSATGDDAASGSQEKPVRTLNQAVSLAMVADKRIYACAEEFEGALELPAGITVYGGLDCAVMPRSWLYVGDKTKTTITAAAETIPLTLAPGPGTKLFDLHVVAKAAVNPGGSSIAVVADLVTAEILRCAFDAGDAQIGAQGKPYSTAAMAGTIGANGGDACSAGTVLGGDSIASMCGNPDSISGSGGIGAALSGGSGSPGAPSGSTNGGAGEIALACTTGTKGDDGTPGISGAGAAGLGAISKSGFAGVIGEPGLLGPAGQGGGGGGGAKGGTGVGKCLVPGMAGGAAGGSGGSGGCGGTGGKGGNPGGSSIAILSLGSTLTFVGVTLTTGAGGKGGDGGVGQDGGFGGPPGTGGTATGMNGLNPGCNGGPGGSGGKGGKGGGGTGGHSIAIAFTGAAPAKSGWMAATGAFGAGGLGADPAGAGAPGVKADIQVFP
jgi:hypothetical protein